VDVDEVDSFLFDEMGDGGSGGTGGCEFCGAARKGDVVNFVEGFDAFGHFADAIGGALDDAAEFAQAFDPGQMKCPKVNGN
jgi:hypothetical protein